MISQYDVVFFNTGHSFIMPLFYSLRKESFAIILYVRLLMILSVFFKAV